MDLLVHHLDNVNWTGVLLATLASYAVGGVWYAKPVTGARWMKLVGLKDKDMKSGNMMLVFALSGVLALLISVGLATLMSALDFTTWQQGAFLGLLIGLVFLSANRGIHSLFEKKGGLELFIIHIGHDLLYFSVAGAIIGAF